MERKQGILIDTDIGDDIDDALALALALRSPELEIRAITTVFKNTAERARLASALLSQFGRHDIPVYEGTGMPIINEVAVHDIPCQCAVVDFDQYRKNDMHAADAILQAVRSDPALTIIAIGPLTNLALACLKEPETMRSARIMLMGGAFGTTEAEWNIVCDPEAASVVFRSGAQIKVFGLDVTARCALKKEYELIAQQRGDAEARFLMRLFDAWHRASGYGIMLHDPLVIGALLHPEWVHYEKQKVIVELRGENTRGSTILKRSFFKTYETPNAQVATDVNAEAFIEFFMSRVFPE